MTRAIGWGLIVFGLVSVPFALAAFTATEKPPLWLNILGSIGFSGWWAFIVVGAIVLRRSKH